MIAVWTRHYFYDSGNLVCRECAVRSIPAERPQCDTGKPWTQKITLDHDERCSLKAVVGQTLTISGEEVP